MSLKGLIGASAFLAVAFISFIDDHAYSDSCTRTQVSDDFSLSYCDDNSAQMNFELKLGSHPDIGSSHSTRETWRDFQFELNNGQNGNNSEQHASTPQQNIDKLYPTSRFIPVLSADDSQVIAESSSPWIRKTADTAVVTFFNFSEDLYACCSENLPVQRRWSAASWCI